MFLHVGRGWWDFVKRLIYLSGVNIHYRLYPLPPIQGRARSSEEALNVLLCLGRGALPSATRGQAGEGTIL